ncbi:MAG: anaerobic ribonucleoside-triphosphate reductase activating protein [Desulfobacteraceae bacterium]
MVIGGIQKSSLIDYPGKVSCVLFLSGCNFRCPYCHNPELVTDTPPADDGVTPGEALEFLRTRRDFLDGVVITGGEPTLAGDLPELCENIRRMDLSVKLDTNGSRPKAVRTLLEAGFVDYVAMDIKTDPCLYGKTPGLRCRPEEILESVSLIMSSAPDYEFRTTCVRPLVDDEVIKKTAGIIKGARRYALQHFQGEKLLDPAFFAGTDPSYDQDGMERLREAAAPWVKECLIR